MRFPITLERLDHQTVMATCPTVPEIVTAGTDEDEALDMALDALLTLLDHMMERGEEIPFAAACDEPAAPFIELPPMAVVKLAIYQGMRDQGVSQLKMAARLHTDPKSVRRLLDLYHRSKWDHLEMALEALGYRAVVRVEPSKVYKGFFGGEVKERVVG